tara:strand:- start:68 stop:454 length:387 start_codon:yes stop_codon:yes gene_type:complete
VRRKKLQLNEKEKLNVQLEKRGSKMDFEEVLLSVLEDFKDINLHSESGRNILVKEMMVRLKDPNVGWFLDFSDGISDLKNKKRQALGGDYIYSRDLSEGKQLEIFESPDGGETIRSRKVNDYDGGHLG